MGWFFFCYFAAWLILFSALRSPRPLARGLDAPETESPKEEQPLKYNDMAKLYNGLLGNSKNKIGNLVTYVAKGQQIARAKAANIANPRTEAQMRQRVKLANLVAMYRLNRGWQERLAFENKPATNSVFNAFVSANLSASSVALTKQEAAAGACIVCPYKMTDGSLPQIIVNETTTAGRFASNLNTGDLSTLEGVSVGAFSAALIAANNGIVEGMQLSFIMNYQQQANDIYRAFERHYEVILNTADESPLSDRLDLAHVGIVAGTLGYIESESDPLVGFAFVLSHTISGHTRVSPSYLVLTDTGLVETYSSAAQIAAAIASYGAGEAQPFLAEGYQTSSASVDITPTIVSVRYFDGEPIPVGGYLGAPSGENPTLYVNLSSNPAELPASVTTRNADGVDGTSTAIALEGNTYRVSMGDVGNPSTPITRVQVILANGVVLTANFAATSTGGDVQE